MSLIDKFNQWEQNLVQKTVERFPERKETFTTSSEIEVKRLYTP